MSETMKNHICVGLISLYWINKSIGLIKCREKWYISSGIAKGVGGRIVPGNTF